MERERAGTGTEAKWIVRRRMQLSARWAASALFALACSPNPNSTNETPLGGEVTSGGNASGGQSSSFGGSTGGTSSGGTAASSGSTSGGSAGLGGTAASGGTANGGAGLGGTSGGSAGAAGAIAGSGAGGGAMPTNCQSGTPSPATDSAKFPFPQHRFATSCIYPPACSDNDVSTGWQNYKTKFIVDGGDGSLRVQRPENSNDSVSEGIAYGMLFAVTMNDKTTFDKIWQYAQKHLDGSGLMNWQISADGGTQGSNSATDADEDMGFALILAERQWGGYATTAKDFLGKVLSKDFGDDGTAHGGDNYGDVNPSYLAPAFYRTFAEFTGDSKWQTVLDKSYEILQGAENATTGLVPDWSSGPRGGSYTYDAARTPYRIALDACWNGEPRAQAYAQKVSAFFAMVGVANIRDGFALDGTITGEHKNSTFIGPAGVAGMAGSQPQLVLDAYAQVASDLQAGTESYYNMSWALFAAMMMTGNFVDFTHF